MRAVTLAITLVCSLFSITALSIGSHVYQLKYQEAQSLLQNGKAESALNILNPLLKDKKNYRVLIATAQSYAVLNNPKEALKAYQQAYNMKKSNQTYQRIALFGIAKMDLWLGDYDKSAQTYKTLLAMQLDKQDRALAKAGLEKIHKSQAPVKKPVKKKVLKKPTVSYANVRKMLSKNKGNTALKLLRNKKYKRDFIYYYLTAKAYALIEKPKSARKNYQRALQQAKAEEDIKATLLGLGKMEIWLEYYSDAEKTYRRLLKMPLNSKDHELALSGLVRSLSLQDRPREALNCIPPDFPFTTPIMLVSAMQAANWANLFYVSRILSDQNHSILKDDRYSYLSRTIKEETWLTHLQTAKNSITTDNYFETDSDKLSVKKYRLAYGHHFTPALSAKLNLQSARYARNDLLLRAKSFLLGPNWYINRYLHFIARVGAADFNNGWSPTLWSAGLTITPDDFIQFTLANSQDYIEAFPALLSRIQFNTTDLSIAVHPYKRLFLSGSAFHQNFSDKNNRNGFFTRGMWVLSTTLGALVEVRYRYYTNTQPFSPNYFSPDKYRSIMFMLRIRRRLFNTWHYYLEGGLGRQTVSVADNSRLNSYELGLRGLVADHLFLRLYYGSSNTIINTSPTGFTRHYAGFALTLYAG